MRDTVRRLAMSRPDVAFTLAGEERAPVTFAATLPGGTGRLTRLGDVLGADFRANAVAVAGLWPRVRRLLRANEGLARDRRHVRA